MCFRKIIQGRRQEIVIVDHAERLCIIKFTERRGSIQNASFIYSIRELTNLALEWSKATAPLPKQNYTLEQGRE